MWIKKIKFTNYEKAIKKFFYPLFLLSLLRELIYNSKIIHNTNSIITMTLLLK